MNEMNIIVKSSTFKEGEWIPVRYTARGDDYSPPLEFEEISKKAKSIAITMDDASHPLFPNFNHWVIWNIPVQKNIPEGISHGKILTEMGNAIQGVAYGRHRYKGPKPPFKSIHNYIFTVYILDCILDLSFKSRKLDLIAAIEGNILQTGTISGKFQSGRKE